jgi:hypothetical protein
MSIQMVLLPLFVLVFLTFGIGLWMATLRSRVLRSREVQIADVVLGQPNWPPRVTQISNAFHNQLEMPVLFYVLTILAIITRHADLLFVLMAWVFVVMRVLHVYVHVTSNNIRARGGYFGAGVLVLMLMWLIFAVRILLGIG